MDADPLDLMAGDPDPRFARAAALVRLLRSSGEPQYNQMAPPEYRPQAPSFNQLGPAPPKSPEQAYNTLRAKAK